MKPEKCNYIAIDIAKDSLQVQTAVESFSIANHPKGFVKLLERTRALKNPFVVCEASGGYERPLMAFLFARKIPVAPLNPAGVRDFIRSEGIKAKTDPIDTRMLLRFALWKQPRPTAAPKPEEQELAALMDRGSHLTEQLAREKNRRRMAPRATVRSIERMIKLIQKEITRFEASIDRLIDSNRALKVRFEIILSVMGVGKVTAWSILAYLGEIDRMGRNQLVALAGVAPFNKDSGKKRGKRSIQAGRAKVRKTLYMAAQSAAVHNPVIKAYVDGLRARGKPYKCAIVAAMRKLLIHIQSQLKNEQLKLAF